MILPLSLQPAGRTKVDDYCAARSGITPPLPWPNFPPPSTHAEGLVGFSPCNFMVPIPRFATWEAFGGDVEAQWRKPQNVVLSSPTKAIGERPAPDLAVVDANWVRVGQKR